MVESVTGASERESSGEWSLAGIVREHANNRGSSPMLTYGEREISYAEMHERSNRLAQGLLGEGACSQDHVAFLDKNSPEYFEILFGCAKVNAITVAVNWRLAPREVAYIVNDAEAKILFVGQEFLAQVDEIEASLLTIKKIVVIGSHPRHESYEAWLGRQSPTDPDLPVAPDDVAMQLYTSGTTGAPKGAMLTNRNLGTLVAEVCPRLGFDAAAVSLVAMPLFHIGGSGWALLGLWNGCHSILIRDLIPQQLLADIQKHRVTNAFLVPALLQVLCATPGSADGDYASLRAIVYGASPITSDALVRAMQTFKCDFIQLYGLTEVTGAITQLDAEDHDPSGPRTHLLRSAGRPFPWVELRIVDPTTEQTQPIGEVGEIWTRSIQNMKGYWNNAEETAKVITSDGWLKTGDAGYVDGDGYVFLTDRIKDMIVSGGENIYPIEVENALADHPDIADVAVIGVPNEKWGESVTAIVVRKPDSSPSPESIIAFARERLAHFKCPTAVHFADLLPRNPSGKILKRELREPFWKGHERQVN